MTVYNPSQCQTILRLWRAASYVTSVFITKCQSSFPRFDFKYTLLGWCSNSSRTRTWPVGKSASQSVILTSYRVCMVWTSNSREVIFCEGYGRVEYHLSKADNSFLSSHKTWTICFSLRKKTVTLPFRVLYFKSLDFYPNNGAINCVGLFILQPSRCQQAVKGI